MEDNKIYLPYVLIAAIAGGGSGLIPRYIGSSADSEIHQEMREYRKDLNDIHQKLSEVQRKSDICQYIVKSLQEKSNENH